MYLIVLVFLNAIFLRKTYFKHEQLFHFVILNFSSVPFEERILAVLKWLQLPTKERYAL